MLSLSRCMCVFKVAAAKKKGKAPKKHGEFVLNQTLIYKKNSFLDFIRGGLNVGTDKPRWNSL